MRHMMWTLVAAVGMSMPLGCATAPTNTDLPADHPANPAAPVAAIPAPSNTLALDPAALPAPGMGDGGNGMQHEGRMSGMDHGTTAGSGTQHEGHGTRETAATGAVETTGPAESRSMATTVPVISAITYTCPMH